MPRLDFGERLPLFKGDVMGRMEPGSIKSAATASDYLTTTAMSSDPTNTNNTSTLSEEPSTYTATNPVQAQGPQGTQAQAPTDGAPIPQNAAEPPIVPFKDRVIGVAKKTRGTLLGKVYRQTFHLPERFDVVIQPELKEHGEKILQGEASIHDEPQSAS
ncbi:hypothetical protein B0H11DRAFT_2017246 [Mycena galericulata]|nr:hypothetical protein B0H11DRAFT_2017246 [Mycena galericulata]